MDRATRRFIPCGPGATHDLIRPIEPIALTADAPAPSWLGPALKRAPWVVVRRGPVCDGLIPVGARGSARHQRLAAFLSVAEIAERLSPEDLVASGRGIAQERRDAVPALAALPR